jgi:hypothetical protein
MALKVSKLTLVILTVVVLSFGALFLYVGISVPGEREILERIAALEKQPQPTYCPHPLEGEGLLVEVTRMAIAYAVNGKYKKASPFFLRAVEMKKKLCGAEYPGLFGPMLQLAESYDLEGSADKADPVYLELIELIKKSLESELATLREKPESSLKLDEREALHSNRPASISGMLTGTIHMLQVSGKAKDAEPLQKRIEWLRSREPQ